MVEAPSRDLGMSLRSFILFVGDSPSVHLNPTSVVGLYQGLLDIKSTGKRLRTVSLVQENVSGLALDRRDGISISGKLQS